MVVVMYNYNMRKRISYPHSSTGLRFNNALRIVKRTQPSDDSTRVELCVRMPVMGGVLWRMGNDYAQCHIQPPQTCRRVTGSAHLPSPVLVHAMLQPYPHLPSPAFKDAFHAERGFCRPLSRFGARRIAIGCYDPRPS